MIRLGLFFALLGLLPLPVQAVSPAAYDQALASVQSSLTSQAQAIRAGQIPSGEAPLLVAQRLLQPISSVEAQRVPQPVSNVPLIAAIRTADALPGPAAKASAFEELSLQILTLRRALVRSSQSGKPRLAANAMQSVRAVLAEDQFASDPPPPPSAAERAAVWLDRWLARLFSPRSPNLPPMKPINPAWFEGLFYAIIAAALAGLVFVLVKILGQTGVKARPLGLGEEEAVLAEARDYDSLLSLADQQAKAGDYRRAFRLVYLAALVALDTGGVLRFDRSKTNWEYLRALRAAGRGDLYQTLTPLTREFDQVWYGFSRTDASQYANALAQYQALMGSSAAQNAARPTVSV